MDFRALSARMFIVLMMSSRRDCGGSGVSSKEIGVV